MSRIEEKSLRLLLTEMIEGRSHESPQGHRHRLPHGHPAATGYLMMPWQGHPSLRSDHRNREQPVELMEISIENGSCQADTYPCSVKS